MAAGAEGTSPTLLALSVDGAPVPWDKLRFGALAPGAPAPAPPAADEAVVDLARGYAELGSGLTGTVRATWHRPVPGDLGALASDADVDPSARVVVVVNPALPATGNVVRTLAAAFTKARSLSAGLSPEDSDPEHPDVEIRLETSDRLNAPPAQAFAPDVPRWRIVAQRLATPTIAGTLSLDLTGACVTLEGFFLDGHLRLGADLECVHLRHVTMNPATGREVRVAAGAWGLCLRAERSILGAIRADLGAAPLVLEDCIVDGRGAPLRVCEESPASAPKDAIGATSTFPPALEANGVTFAGPVRLEALDAVDCLFLDGVEVVQTQEGCVRHCYLGPDLSASPRHPVSYRCGPFPAPTFDSIGFEAAGYYTLALEPHHPLQSAASDGGEVGAYHHARRAARVAALATADSRVRPARPASRPGAGDLGGMMTGDYTKVPLRPDDRWTGARMQQGRVLLDHEWNLNVDAGARTARGTAADVIGPAGVVAGSSAFAVGVTASGTLEVNVRAGRIWVDGLMAYAPADVQILRPGSDRAASDERRGARLPRRLRASTSSRPRRRTPWSTRRWRRSTARRGRASATASAALRRAPTPARRRSTAWPSWRDRPARSRSSASRPRRPPIPAHRPATRSASCPTGCSASRSSTRAAPASRASPGRSRTAPPRSPSPRSPATRSR